MKKAERIVLYVSIAALLYKIFHGPGSTILVILSLSLLAFIYCYLSFLLFSGIRLRKIFKKSSYKGISARRIIFHVLTGFALGILVNGIIFKIQAWPGASLMLYMGMVGLFPICILLAIDKLILKKGYASLFIMSRSIGFFLLSLVLVLIPFKTWTDWRYSGFPDYAKSLIELHENPQNLELKQKERLEYLKMRYLMMPSPENKNELIDFGLTNEEIEAFYK